MKQRILLFFVMTAVVTGLQAQKKKMNAPVTTGYAITAIEKGGRSWKEVRQIDAATGAVLKDIYNSKQESEPLNARTGKPVAKKGQPAPETVTRTFRSAAPQVLEKKKVLNLDEELAKVNGNTARTYTHTVTVRYNTISPDKPFASSSAAMAYDKKHERLYYTPMAINQLRYIDLKSGKIYYFEDEPFGVVKGMGDVHNQVTRMVIAADGNGYALTNDANHLIRFTTGKNPVITDLGAITDDGAQAKYSIHSSNGFGGDMIADASGNLYLFTAKRNVFKINIESRVAQYLGAVKGLPQGFSTNGAMVEGGSKVIVASSESTAGYYRVDLNTLESEKISSVADVFNAADLANANLAFAKNKKEKKQEEKTDTAVPDESTTAKNTDAGERIANSGISIYPNPVTNGSVSLSFAEQPAGKYQVQLLDLSGRLISAKEVNISSSAQIETFRFPELSVKGNYLLKVISEANSVNVTNKLIVQ